MQMTKAQLLKMINRQEQRIKALEKANKRLQATIMKLKDRPYYAL